MPSDIYESWADEPRESARVQFVELLIALGQKHIDAGDFADAAEAFRRVLGIDPLDESAHQGLMRAFAQQGNRSQALHQYKRCEEILAKELEAKPSAETIALLKAIREGKIQPAPQAAPKKAVAAKPASALHKRSPLVGRQNELKRITTLFDNLAQGKGGVSLLQGAAGIGKTRLAQEIFYLAELRGYQPLVGSAYEQEKELPYSPFVEALRMAINASPRRPCGDSLLATISAFLPPAPRPLLRFNALRALGYFSTQMISLPPFSTICFNALRALGYFSTILTVACSKSDNMFQCTSCFGVLLNFALGVFVGGEVVVSMHFVLWGTSQRDSGPPPGGSQDTFQCTSCFGVLLNRSSSPKRRGRRLVSMHFVLWGTSQPPHPDLSHKNKQVSMHFVLWGTSQRGKTSSSSLSVLFQCTSCFGVLLNSTVGLDNGNFLTVSMHFVLWGTSQRSRIPRRKLRRRTFQCTSCFGVLLNLFDLSAPSTSRCFNALRALGYFST